MTLRASKIGIGPRQVRKYIAAGVLRAELVGGTYIIRRADLARVPKDRKPGPKPAGKKRRKATRED